MFNIDDAKSYATEENLLKALTRFGLHTAKHIVVRNRAGRFTAIFGYSWNPTVNAGYIAHAGFKVVG